MQNRLNLSDAKPEPFMPRNITQKQKNTKVESVKNFVTSKRFLAVVALVEFVIILWLINPSAILTRIQNDQVVREVSGLTTINTTETPVVAVITNANALRDENTIQAEIYKDAQNGDYVIGYTDKMIIYRRQDSSIIYEGETPQLKLESTQEELLTNIITAAKDSGAIDRDSVEVPQVSVISDARQLRQTNPGFYSEAQNGDILAYFLDSGVLVIYRDETKEIINAGAYSTTIQ
jgi:hypothetical protein